MRSFFLLLTLLLTVGGCREAPAGEDSTAVRRPNILFAIADDASFPHMGAYGTTWVSTPAFDRIAREGLLFNRAYTPNAKCAPSRACILTGRNSWQLEEAANHSPFFPAKFATVVEALAAHGYRTGYTGKGWAPGDPGQRNGRRRELTGPAYNAIQREAPTEDMSGIDYAANFANFLAEGEGSASPFFFWYGGYEPHRAYTYGSGLAQTDRTLADPRVPAMWPDTDTVRTDLLDYALEIDYFDTQLGEMLQLLEERGELDNTLIVVTADNGMPFPRIKGQAYEMSNHLPLAVRWADGIDRPGRKIEDFVSFIDLAPTFLAVAGVDWSDSGMQPATGKSLRPLFAGQELDAPFRDQVLIGKERHDVGRPDDRGYPIRGIVSGDYLYVKNYAPDRWPVGNPETGYLNTDGSPTKTQLLRMRRSGTDTSALWPLNFGKRPGEELYNIREDPYCLSNLVDDANLSAQLAALRERMEGALRQEGDPRMAGNGAVFDNYPYSGAVRDYYNRYLAGEEVPASWVEASDYEQGPLD